MTLSELLEELKQIDPETELEISDITLNLDQWSAPYKDDIIQGRIQRACERRGWTWCIYKQTPEEKKSHCAEISKITPGYDGDCYNQYHESCIAGKEADTAAEALLAAYIAAVKEERRSTALAEE
jgi:hypothetical protein